MAGFVVSQGSLQVKETQARVILMQILTVCQAIRAAVQVQR